MSHRYSQQLSKSPNNNNNWKRINLERVWKKIQKIIRSHPNKISRRIKNPAKQLSKNKQVLKTVKTRVKMQRRPSLQTSRTKTQTNSVSRRKRVITQRVNLLRRALLRKSSLQKNPSMRSKKSRPTNKTNKRRENHPRKPKRKKTIVYKTIYKFFHYFNLIIF